jgi:O-antigen ligase/Flp pilus assembly protein TadD
MSGVVAQSLKWQRVLVAVGLSVSALAFWSSPGDIFGVPKATVIVLMAIACLAVGVGRQIRERQIVLPKLWCMAAAGAFLVALTITTITSTTPMQSFVGEYQQYAGFCGYLCGVVIFLTVARGHDKTTLPALAFTLVGTAVVVLAYALLQRFDADPWHLGSAGTVVSTMGNVNFLAGWIGIMFPLCVAVAVAPVHPAWRVVGGVAAVVIVPVSVWTDSFQGPATVGAAAVAVLVLLLVTRTVPVPRPLRGKRGVAVVVGLGVLLAPVAFVVLRDGIDQGLLERRHFWHVALEVFEEHPIVGTGPDTFHNQYLMRRPAAHAAIQASKNAGAAHDVPLDLLANGGILLGGTYLAWVGLVAWRLVVAVRRRRAPGWLIAGFGAAWIGYLVQSLVSIDRPALLIINWALAGAVVALSGPLPAQVIKLRGWTEDGTRDAPVASIAGIALVGLVAVTLGWFATRPIRADWAAIAGRNAFRHGQVDQAEADFKKARRLAPWEATFTFDLVRVYGTKNDVKDVLAAAEEGAHLEPGDSSYFLVVAQLGDAVKQPDLAREWYDKALKIDPYGVEVLGNAALSAAKDGDATRADQLVDRLLAVTDTRGDVWATVGDVRAAEGDAAAAREAYERSLKLLPDNKPAKTGLEKLGQ